MTLNKYNEFINESRKQELLVIEPGYVAILNKDINIGKDIDFKKTAKTWFGRNISHVDNYSFNDNNLIKDEIIWIQVDENNVYSKNIINKDDDFRRLSTTLYNVENNEDYINFRLSMVTILQARLRVLDAIIFSFDCDSLKIALE